MKGFELTSTGKTSNLKVLGPISEDCEFPPALNCDKLIVDMDRMTTINSYGLRLWLVWSKATGAKNLELVNCRPGFLNQLRHVKELIPAQARVTSFYVPYFDPDSESSVYVKMEYGKDFTDSGYTVPSPKNEKGTALELDVDDKYFAFLKR